MIRHDNYFAEVEKEAYDIIKYLNFSYDESENDYFRRMQQADKNVEYFGGHEILDVQKIRKDFPILQTQQNGYPLIWLDNAATTQKPQFVIDAMSEFYEKHNSNIHRGNYELSRKASEMYETARQDVAVFINAANAEEIIFVRGTTEGLNFIANTYGKHHIKTGDEIIITLLEHHSNILPWKELCQSTGAILKVVPIDQNGDILLSDYMNLLNSKTKIVAFAHVSNSIGSVLPIHTMISAAKTYGATVIIDAAQSIPHQPIDVQSLNCDFLVFSGHKMFGPTGIGVVYGKKEILEELPVWQVGGGMIQHVSFSETIYADVPYKFEAGTGNTASVIGLSAAIKYLSHINMAKVAAYEKQLLDYALNALKNVPCLKFIGMPKERAGVISFTFDKLSLERIGDFLDQHGIALRIGHHCAQPTMKFFGFDSIIRSSFSFYNSFEEIDFFAAKLYEFVTHDQKIVS